MFVFKLQRSVLRLREERLLFLALRSELNPKSRKIVVPASVSFSHGHHKHVVKRSSAHNIYLKRQSRSSSSHASVQTKADDGSKVEEKSPYWLTPEKTSEKTSAQRKASFFRFRLPRLKSDALKSIKDRLPWKPRTNTDRLSSIQAASEEPQTLCDDSLASMHLNRTLEMLKDIEQVKHKQSLCETTEPTTLQEEALIAEYLKYQKDLASRLGDFWGDKPLTEKDISHLSEAATDVKLSPQYNSLNRILNSYSATINSLSNVHKHLQKYEKFIPQAIMDRFPAFESQKANASILEGTTQNPDVVTVKSVQGLRRLLKRLEDEESRINKEQIEAKKAEFRDLTFRHLFACRHSPFADEEVVRETNDTRDKTENKPTQSRWRIPGWDSAHSLDNASLFPPTDMAMPGRNSFVEEENSQAVKNAKVTISRPELEKTVNDLISAAKESKTPDQLNQSLYNLNSFLRENSKIRTVVHEQRLVAILGHRLKKADGDDLQKALIRETFSLAGHVAPLPKRGIRILAIDGGGVRAVMTVLLLRRLQDECGGTPLHSLFDYVVGVSTGSILAVMSLMYRVPIDDCEQMYKLFSLEVFKRNLILGATRLVWNQAYYDSDYWSQLLQGDFGELSLSETARSENIPKMAIVSAATNLPTLTPFLFRNYNLPPNTPSHYPGSCNFKVWEAVRASSAAPGYFEECKLRGIIHQDGGLIMNNPSSLAIHEAKLLWPEEEIQCLVSLGTGRYYPHGREDYASSGLKSKINKLIASATDTEAVHIVLQDLLPKGRYFRFNPYMTEDILLDENRPEKIDQLVQDGELYLRKNGSKMKKAGKKLMEDRQTCQKIRDLKKSSKASLGL